jgi:hypothetical protein
VAYANGPGIAADFRTQMFSAYAQDVWTATPRLTVSGGLRLDVPRLPDSPPYNPNVTNGFSARGISAVSTTGTPKTRALWSPRLGVNWDVTGRQTFQVRANAGVYTGQPPYILIGNAYQNTGAGLAFLNCTGAQTPAFTTDVTALPTACQGGTPPQQGSAGTAGVNLTDPNFRFPQRFVTSAGFDRQLPAGFVLSFEGLYGRDINGIRVRDLNILGPRLNADGTPLATNTGRFLYADTILPTQTNGNTPITNATNLRAIVRNGQNNVLFNEGAIYLTNQSKAYNYAFTPSLRKRFSRSLDLTTSYTYTRAFEVQSFTSDRAISIWRNGREYAGLENADDLTTSAYELRHRVQLYGTLTAPWRRFPTDVSFEYSGNTGAPITFTANGDLNGDGFNNNDPLYIPRNAADPSEIRIGTLASGVFTPNANAAASFEHLIQSQQCLREQRGRIMERNSCRGPWENLLNVSLRQTLPEVRGQRLTAQLDVFNFLNLLNDEWGVNRRPILSTFPQQQALTVQGRIPGTIANESNVVYSFDQQLIGPNNTSRLFQDRINAIGNVYRMQLTFRYSF